MRGIKSDWQQEKRTIRSYEEEIWADWAVWLKDTRQAFTQNTSESRLPLCPLWLIPSDQPGFLPGAIFKVSQGQERVTKIQSICMPSFLLTTIILILFIIVIVCVCACTGVLWVWTRMCPGMSVEVIRRSCPRLGWCFPFQINRSRKHREVFWVAGPLVDSRSSQAD